MTVKTFIIGSLLCATLGLVMWCLVLFFLDPTQAGMVGYVLFFLSFFLMLASVAGLVGYGARRVLQASQLSAYSVRSALRQGIMLALFASLLLLLVRIRVYQWWVAVILTVLFVCTELIFFSYDRALKRGH